MSNYILTAYLFTFLVLAILLGLSFLNYKLLKNAKESKK